MKDYLHQNVYSFIGRYTDDKGFVLFPPFHGCNLKNGNGSRKLIDYKMGNNACFLCGMMINQNLKLQYFLSQDTWILARIGIFLRIKEITSLTIP